MRNIVELMQKQFFAYVSEHCASFGTQKKLATLRGEGGGFCISLSRTGSQVSITPYTITCGYTFLKNTNLIGFHFIDLYEWKIVNAIILH